MVLRVAPESGAAREVRDVRIVGVVADNPLRPTVARPDPVIYVPLPKELSGEFTLLVRAADPEALRADLLTLVNRIDPRIVWTSIRRGDMPFQEEAREMAGAIYVVGAAGTVALVLSATGLYAVLSYIVALRRREIGVRLAIGAPPSRIITLVVRQALKLVLAGMACGLAPGRADGVRDARDVRRQSHRHRSDGVLANDLGAARRWHPRRRRPRPSCVSNRSDRHTTAGIGMAFVRSTPSILSR